jgi:HSP90 family molecular chaperone
MVYHLANRESKNRYYRKNKETINKRRKEYNEENKELLSERRKKVRLNHKLTKEEENLIKSKYSFCFKK